MATEPNKVIGDNELTMKELILSIRAWILYLWSKWRVLLIAGMMGGVIGLVVSLLTTIQYTATTTFVLEGGGDSKSGLARLAGVAAVAGLNLGSDAGGLFQGDNILELYRSRTMLVQALLSKTYPDSDELLIDRFVAFRNLSAAWQEDTLLSKLDFHKSPEELTPALLRARDSILTNFANAIRDQHLIVDKPDKKLSIIQVDVTAPDEVFSKVFNETLVRRVNDFYIQTKTKRTAQQIALLETKVDSVRQVMEGAIYSAARVSDATPNLNPTRLSQRVAPTQEAQFAAEANKAILSQLIQNLELARMNLAQEQPLIQLVDQPVYPLPMSRIGKAKGIVIGGILFGFFTLAFLVVRKWYLDTMQAD